ncbi:MAG: endonuclease III [Planctomycetota bacterium]
MSAVVLTPDNPRGLRDLPFALPGATTAQKTRARRIYKDLEERHPDAHCELDFTHPHELLIATILSAQATDVGVNKATPGLFKAFPTPEDYAASSPKQIEPYIKTIGLFRNKAKSVHSAMVRVVEEYGGEVPRTMDELLSLRGVARKTAGVVLGDAFGIMMGVVVDTHVERISKRFGLVPEDATVAMTERHLMAQFPRPKWSRLSHLLIFHGRRSCKARGGACADDDICRKYCSNSRVMREEAKK